ncbi:MAG: PepSY domain-containing protein [Verrucomicrobiales bacterium]|nr:PepSY domain-containing protein [Verrucomicrobiales bacterium]
MKTFRKTLFWVHLVVGLAAGGVIAITVFTGACLAFEKQILAWAERDLRRVTPPGAEVPRVGLDQLVARAREMAPGVTLVGLTVQADPGAAVTLMFGRTNTIYANPYTGDLRAQGPSALRNFFQLMLRWHRWLGVSQADPGQGAGSGRPRMGSASPGDARATGEGKDPQNNRLPEGGAAVGDRDGARREGPGGARALASTVVGISACLLILLCLSGLCLWWPRSWRWTAVRAMLVPNLRLRGKPRDRNWHNAVGLGSAPVLLVMSLTGVVMAFRPVSNMIYGTPATGQGPGPGGSTNQPLFTAPKPGMSLLGLEQSVAIAMREVPDWAEITVRIGGRQRGPRGAGGGVGGGLREGQGMARPREMRGEASASGEADLPSGRRAEGEMRVGRGTPAVSLLVRAVGGGSFPPIQIQLHPFTGEVLRRTSFATQVSEVGWRRALRSLNRTLHTGEVGGWLGQSVAFLACWGGLVLVYTGLALSWRRFFPRRRASVTESTATSKGVETFRMTAEPTEPASSSRVQE